MLAMKLMGATSPSGSGGGLTYVARAWGDSGGATAGSFTIGKPSGTTQGDLMIAAVSGSSNQFMADTGWTQIGAVPGSAFRMALFSKVAGASEPSSYTFAASGAPQKIGGEIQTWRGSAVDQLGTFYQGSGTTNIVMQQVRPNDNAILLAFVTTAASGGTYSTPSGMTSRAVTNTYQPSMASFYQSVVKNTDTGTRTSTPATSGNQRGVLLTLVGS